MVKPAAFRRAVGFIMAEHRLKLEAPVSRDLLRAIHV